jgi:hypothetical protein
MFLISCSCRPMFCVAEVTICFDEIGISKERYIVHREQYMHSSILLICWSHDETVWRWLCIAKTLTAITLTAITRLRWDVLESETSQRARTFVEKSHNRANQVTTREYHWTSVANRKDCSIARYDETLLALFTTWKLLIDLLRRKM